MSLLPVPKNSLQNRLPPHPPNKAFDHNIKLCYSHTIVQGRKAIATATSQARTTPTSSICHTIVQGRKAIATTFFGVLDRVSVRSHHRSRPKGYCDSVAHNRVQESGHLSHHRSRPKGYCDSMSARSSMSTALRVTPSFKAERRLRWSRMWRRLGGASGFCPWLLWGGGVGMGEWHRPCLPMTVAWVVDNRGRCC